MSEKPALPLNTEHFKPGMRLAAAVSGGADSVALLRALAARAAELGLVLSVAHLHHGLRGAEADGDLEFVRKLAAGLGLPFFEARMDTAAEAAALPGKPPETIEEAARRLRYGWFRELMARASGAKAPESKRVSNGTTEVVPLQNGAGWGAGLPVDVSSPVAKGAGPGAPVELACSRFVDAVATAHTLDDQAETVLAKFLRGAWTEGLSGIHPVLEFSEGKIVRPLLGTTRAEVEAYLKALGQDWREDSTNRHLTYTRNRIRHELLPLLEGWNPRLKEHLAQMAELARDEEAWWEDETGRLAEGVLLEGKPVRGGGRASGEGIALDLARLKELAPAVQRRLVRRAAAGLGFALDFAGTEALRDLGLTGKAGQKSELAGGLRAERTHRELWLTIAPGVGTPEADGLAETMIPVPGEGVSSAFELRVRIEVTGNDEPQRTAVLRNWKAGDRVRLKHSASPRKVKEVLERLKITGTARGRWPVVELNGRIVWMKGVAVEPEPGLVITAKEEVGTGQPESP